MIEALYIIIGMYYAGSNFKEIQRLSDNNSNHIIIGIAFTFLFWPFVFGAMRAKQFRETKE